MMNFAAFGGFSSALSSAGGLRECMVVGENCYYLVSGTIVHRFKASVNKEAVGLFIHKNEFMKLLAYQKDNKIRVGVYFWLGLKKIGDDEFIIDNKNVTICKGVRFPPADLPDMQSYKFLEKMFDMIELCEKGVDRVKTDVFPAYITLAMIKQATSIFPTSVEPLSFGVMGGGTMYIRTADEQYTSYFMTNGFQGFFRGDRYVTTEGRDKVMQKKAEYEAEKLKKAELKNAEAKIVPPSPPRKLINLKLKKK